MDTMIATPDFAAIKQRQQATWAAGDYAVVGTTLQIIGERLCEAVDLRAGERVLDVAAGNGNATLFHAGQTLHPRPMTPHVARNASVAAPARLIVSSVTEAGRPSTILVPLTN